MVVLLIAHDIYHLVDGIILKSHLGSTDILCHIHRGAVGAQKQFLVETFICEICPYTVVVMALKETFGETFLHLGLTLEIGLRLIVYLVETNAKRLVGLVETSIHPIVHLFPKGAHLGVVLLPFHQHLMSFLDERSFLLGFFLSLFLTHAFAGVLCGELLHLLTIMLVEGHIIVADKMVALLTAGLRSLTVAIFQPCQHRLADMNTTVVHDIGLHNLIAVGLHDFGKRPSEQVVAHMSEVKRFVGVGRRILNHHQGRVVVSLFLSVFRVGIDVRQQLKPCRLCNHEVEESLNHVE